MGHVAIPVQRPGVTFTERLPEHPRICGCSVSSTVIVKEQGALVFTPSLARTVTVVVPTGNALPDGCE
jgi:hypothetical protein